MCKGYLLMISIQLLSLSTLFLVTSATFSLPFGNYQRNAAPPPPPPMFKPISRSGPLGIQRREPAPLVFPGPLSRMKMRDSFRAATAGLPMRTLMLQLRGSPSRGMAQYVKAPPEFKYLKPNSLPSSPAPTLIVKPLKYESPSKHVRPTSDYSFEKPHVHTTKLQLRVPVDANAGAIRTIPAPNLSVQDNKIQFFSDQKETPKVPFKRPAQVQQYEVEEQTNDVTFKDPYSGKHTLWAPDPDPTLPGPRVKPSNDPLSRPSNYQSLPADVSAQLAQAQQYIASPAQHQSIVAAAPYAYVQSQTPYDYHSYAYTYVPMQQAASTHTANYQPTMLQGMAPYNPSYLVSQSNQLFNQHQQNLNLYKQQEPNYIQEFAQNSLTYNPYAAKLQQQQPQYNAYDVAAAQLQQIQALQAAATQLQYQDQTQAVPYNPHYPTNENVAESQNAHAYTQLIEAQDYNPYATSTQPPLSAKDLASIFKYGTLAQSSEESNEQLNDGSYANTAYYNQYTQQTQDNFQPSHGNTEILQPQETLTPQSAFEQHQQALAAQLSNAHQGQNYPSHGSLRIYVPDEAQSKSDENIDPEPTASETEIQKQKIEEISADDRLDNNYYDGEYEYENEEDVPATDDTKKNASTGTASTLTNHQMESKEK
ncbi:uncharacterized protein LOC134835150 [Culicoides brevitarsis]|uniref:uncharacterized protein LOC134835150 n=1 Tax=Culicoides brevitarsis TaxID=469753 RepID=UPI00307C87CF